MEAVLEKTITWLMILAGLLIGTAAITIDDTSLSGDIDGNVQEHEYGRELIGEEFNDLPTACRIRTIAVEGGSLPIGGMIGGPRGDGGCMQRTFSGGGPGGEFS